MGFGSQPQILEDAMIQKGLRAHDDPNMEGLRHHTNTHTRGGCVLIVGLRCGVVALQVYTPLRPVRSTEEAPLLDAFT